jgi:hypothetical protein
MKTLNLTGNELDVVSIVLNRIHRNMKRKAKSYYELSDVDLKMN